LEWRVNYGPNAVSLTVMLPGDFNGNFIVDAADYVAWRKNDGTQDKYNTWRTNFGRAAGGDGTASSFAAHSAVPEPSSFVMILAGVLTAMRLRRLLETT
jgi:hypothetical protein